MKNFTQGRQAVAVALMLMTIITFTSLPVSAQQSAAAAVKSTEFTATTATGERLSISTSTTAGTVEIKLKAGTSGERAFKFTAAEMQALIGATRRKEPIEGALKETRDRLKEFRDMAAASVDKRALDELSKQLDVTEVAKGKAQSYDQATGLYFVKAAASAPSCLDWASLDYQMCMIEYGNEYLCTLSGMMMLISCYLS